MAIDYKTLLWKYIHHVEQCEGTTFLPVGDFPQDSEVKFTEEESAALTELEEKPAPE